MFWQERVVGLGFMGCSRVNDCWVTVRCRVSSGYGKRLNLCGSLGTSSVNRASVESQRVRTLSKGLNLSFDAQSKSKRTKSPRGSDVLGYSVVCYFPSETQFHMIATL